MLKLSFYFLENRSQRIICDNSDIRKMASRRTINLKGRPTSWFILNMHNRVVHELFCTEILNRPEETLQFPVAFQQGVKRQTSLGSQSRDFKLKNKIEQLTVSTITTGKVLFLVWRFKFYTAAYLRCECKTASKK